MILHEALRIRKLSMQVRKLKVFNCRKNRFGIKLSTRASLLWIRLALRNDLKTLNKVHLNSNYRKIRRGRLWKKKRNVQIYNMNINISYLRQRIVNSAIQAQHSHLIKHTLSLSKAYFKIWMKLNSRNRYLSKFAYFHRFLCNRLP